MVLPIEPVGNQAVPEQAAVACCLLIFLDQVVLRRVLQVQWVADALREQGRGQARVCHKRDILWHLLIAEAAVGAVRGV